MREWLYTHTAAATGRGLSDQGKALRYALTENPVHERLAGEATIPEYFRKISEV